MDYDSNYFNSQGSDPQEDDWLDDIKSLLDDRPGTGASDSVPQPVQPGFPGQSPFPQRSPHPQQGGPAFPDFQAAVPANMPQFQQSRPMPPLMPDSREKPRKKSYTAIIILSIIIVLELAGIAAVVMAWLQWMQ